MEKKFYHLTITRLTSLFAMLSLPSAVLCNVFCGLLAVAEILSQEELCRAQTVILELTAVAGSIVFSYAFFPAFDARPKTINYILKVTS